MRRKYYCTCTYANCLILFGALLHFVTASTACNIAEFECNNKRCIQLDKFCNRVNDCGGGDSSDEPPGCSVCNRTYYGAVGFTYALTRHHATSCTLTFDAAGGSFGDVVQLSLPLSTTASASNCTKSLEIRELNNPHHKASFCSASGFKTETLSNFFSESNRVQIQFNSQLDITYRFLRVTIPRNRGTLLQGTLCSSVYENCENNCTLQTPNFPGLYPGNSTCYWAIRETNVPPGLRALIKLSGEVHVGVGELRSSDCSSDYVTIYDGYSIRDPELIKFCGHGAVEEVISSHNEILVQFYSGGIVSTVGPVKGLNLVATTILISKDSYAYSENHNCYHTISSFENERGRLVSPVHSLPGNTTCTYNFQGRSSQRVWLSFLKFNLKNGSFIEIGESLNHSPRTTVASIKPNTNNTLSTGLIFTAANFPPICEFLLITNARACLPFLESLLSNSPQLTLKYTTVNGTVLEKSSFIVNYEFVQDAGEDSNCSRLFKQSTGAFSSTRNVLLFGRAGKSSLKCVYRFEASKGQNIRVTLKTLSLRGRSSCVSTIEPISRRVVCRTLNVSKLLARLEFRQILETANDSYSVLRECFCGDETRTNPVIFISTTNIVELVMTVENMGATDDHHSFYFDGTYEMLNMNLCPEPLIFAQSTIMTLTKPSTCDSSFYVLPPLPYTYLQLKSSTTHCKPLVIHTSHSQKYVCLQYDYTTFSPGFLNYTFTSPHSNIIILELLESDISLSYLQVSSPVEPHYNYVTELRDTCGGFKCESINACVHKSLFCNGIENCPSGEDEIGCTGFDYTVPLIVGMGIIIIFLALWLCCTKTERKGVG